MESAGIVWLNDYVVGVSSKERIREDLAFFRTLLLIIALKSLRSPIEEA